MMTSLIYRIIDNENAAATVSAAMTEHVVRNYGDVSGSSQLHSKYNELGRVYGYLNAIGNERATDLAAADAEESRRAKESMGTALAVVTTIAGSGISGPVAPLLWSVGTTVTTPLVLDELAPGTLPDYDDLVEDGRDALESQAYVEAVNRGVLSGDDVYNPGNLQDDRGVLYGWVVEKDGALQLALPANPTGGQNVQVHDWRYKIEGSDAANKSEDSDADTESESADAANEIVLDDVELQIDTGVSRGGALVSGSDGAGGEPGSIAIKK